MIKEKDRVIVSAMEPVHGGSGDVRRTLPAVGVCPAVWAQGRALLCRGPLPDEKLVLLMPRSYPPCGHELGVLDLDPLPAQADRV